MKIEIDRSKKNGKWTFSIDGEVITSQSTLNKCLFKAYKYTKAQGI